jgi:hypothetical protein
MSAISLLGGHADKPEVHVECSEELERAQSPCSASRAKCRLFYQALQKRAQKREALGVDFESAKRLVLGSAAIVFVAVNVQCASL